MKKLIVGMLLFVACQSVNAESISDTIKSNGSYKNSNNVTITTENYNKMKEFMSDEEINDVDENFYERVKNSKEIKAYTSTYIESKYVTIGNDRFLLSEKEITKDEYETRGTEDGVYETKSKYLRLMIGISNNGNYSFFIQNKWKKIPDNKSFDVIALRWTGNVSEIPSTAAGGQSYKDFVGQPNPPRIAYQYTSQNFKFASDGVGLSQNLKDGEYYYLNELYIEATCTGTIHLYGTYQHFQGTQTLAQSQSYTLSSSGLGGVLYFSNSTLRDTYDQMNGLHLATTC